MNDRQSTSVVEVEGRGGWDYDISNLEWNKEYCIIITHTTSYVSTLTYIGHLRYFRLLIFGGLDVKNSLFNMLYLGFHNSKMVWLSSQKFIEFSLQPFAYYWPPHAKFALGFEEICTAHKKPFNFWSFNELVFENLSSDFSEILYKIPSAFLLFSTFWPKNWPFLVQNDKAQRFL